MRLFCRESLLGLLLCEFATLGLQCLTRDDVIGSLELRHLREELVHSSVGPTNKPDDDADGSSEGHGQSDDGDNLHISMVPSRRLADPEEVFLVPSWLPSMEDRCHLERPQRSSMAVGSSSWSGLLLHEGGLPGGL